MKVSGISLAPQTQAAKEDAKLKRACQDFESVLVTYMLGQMRNTVQKTDLFGSSEKEDMFQGMLDQETAKDISTNGSMGIADMMYKQLSQINSLQPPTPKLSVGELKSR